MKFFQCAAVVYNGSHDTILQFVVNIPHTASTVLCLDSSTCFCNALDSDFLWYRNDPNRIQEGVLPTRIQQNSRFYDNDGFLMGRRFELPLGTQCLIALFNFLLNMRPYNRFQPFHGIDIGKYNASEFFAINGSLILSIILLLLHDEIVISKSLHYLFNDWTCWFVHGMCNRIGIFLCMKSE